MPRVLFYGSDGERKELEVPVGATMMEAALDNSVAGIVAECSGACACATCHAYVPDPWFDKLPAVSELEDAMLDMVAERQPNSRLTCQIKMTDELDGIEIHATDNEF